MGFIQKEKVIRLLISLLIATFLWGYVTNMQNPIQRKTFSNIPVTILNMDYLESQSLSISDNLPLTISVVAEGRYSAMQNFKETDLEAVLDFQDLALKEGLNAIPLEVASKSQSVTIVKEKTDIQVKVTMEKLLQKEFPVVVKIEGELGAGYSAGEPVISKDKVLVLGTKDALNTIKYLSVPVDFSNSTKSSIKGAFPIKAYNKAGEESSSVIVKDKEMEISIPIFCSKALPIKVVTDGVVAKGYSLKKVSSDPSEVVVYGLAEDISKIDAVKTQLVSIKNKTKSFNTKVGLDLPLGVRVKFNRDIIDCIIEITGK